MKVNSKYNPTAFFFSQSENISSKYTDQINSFVSTLLNLENCILCKNEFNLKERLPRILIHCGHTFCTICLSKFHRNLRIRCPLCLKLVLNIETLERLPINHTIFTQIAKKHNQNHPNEKINISEALYNSFAIASQNKNNEPTFENLGFNQVPPQFINQINQNFKVNL